MSQSGKRAAMWIQVAIMVASIAVFLGGVSLVGGGFTDRGSRFWVTIVSIVFANIVWFNVPIWMAVSGARSKPSFPFQFTAMTFCTVYAAGVFCMALLVMATSVTAGWVFVGHMVLLFFLASSLGVYTMANRAIESMDAADAASKAGAAKLNLHIKSVADKATLCDQAGIGDAQAAVAELVEVMHYATGESLPGAEAVDAEITAHFHAIEQALTAANGAENEQALTDINQTIFKEVKAAKMAISRREELMKTLR